MALNQGVILQGDTTIELIQVLQNESEQSFAKLESLSSIPWSDNELQSELERLQQLTKQLNKNLETSGLSSLPGDLSLDIMDSQAYIKKAREDTDNSRSTLLRIQSNCKTLVQTMAKK